MATYSVTWINAYNEFMKAWMGMIKSDSNIV